MAEQFTDLRQEGWEETREQSRQRAEIQLEDYFTDLTQ
jgi:hypothetical protein